MSLRSILKAFLDFLKRLKMKTVAWNNTNDNFPHCKSERSVLIALKIGPFQWVKYGPIFESNSAPLNQGQYSPIGWDWFGPWAEMGPTVGCNGLLM